MWQTAWNAFGQISWAEETTFGALFFVFLWATMTRRMVFGWHYRELEQDRDNWRSVALASLHVNGKVTEMLKQDALWDTKLPTPVE